MPPTAPRPPRSRGAAQRALACAIAAGSIAGCASPPALFAPPHLEDVTLLLSWTHRAEFAGFYAAGGAYREAGLNVSFVPGGPQAYTAQRIAEGGAQFGLAPVASLLRARAAGHDVVAIAAVYQRNPVAFFAFADMAIEHPRDLAGKRVAYGPEGEPLLLAMFHRLGLDPATVQQAPLTLDPAPWYRGETDAWSGYAMDLPLDARGRGLEVTTLFPDDWGVHLYGPVVVVQGSLARERPALVRAFLAASLAGWRAVLADPAEAVEATLARDGDLDPGRQRAFFEASSPLIRTGREPLLWIDPVRWASGHALLVASGAVPPDPRGPPASALELRFLEEVHAPAATR